MNDNEQQFIALSTLKLIGVHFSQYFLAAVFFFGCFAYFLDGYTVLQKASVVSVLGGVMATIMVLIHLPLAQCKAVSIASGSITLKKRFSSKQEEIPLADIASSNVHWSKLHSRIILTLRDNRRITISSIGFPGVDWKAMEKVIGKAFQ